MNDEDVKIRLRFNANRIKSLRSGLKKESENVIHEAKEIERKREEDSEDVEVNLLRSKRRAELLKLLSNK